MIFEDSDFEAGKYKFHNGFYSEQKGIFILWKLLYIVVGENEKTFGFAEYCQIIWMRRIE